MSLLGDTPFYHASVRKLVSSFGELFSDIVIVKKDSAGDKEQVIKVPIQYAPRNKWLEILKEDPQKSKNVQFTLPRMAFEITKYQYDSTRKIGPQGQFLTGTYRGRGTKLYNPVPYDVYINLYTVAKTQEESLQLLEQIVPYFAPSMTITLEILPEFGITKDIPIVLNSVSVDDNYQGLATDFRLVEQTFQFVAQMDFFGPIITSNKLIKHTDVSIITNLEQTQNKYVNHQDVVPETANKSDSYVVEESWGLE